MSNPLSGCPIATSTSLPTGGSGVIVIVDAYDYPSAAADLATFSTDFGLPQANFTVQYASGRKPSNGCRSGWQGEEALDIEWAHAMAPNAQIVLMEASSATNTALYQAVTAANSYIASHGGKGEVSMSWGGSETSGETSSDHYFTQSGVVYFASSGDSPGVIYPSSSPYVVSAGGTQVNRSSGNYTNQTAWSDGGGGASKYEARPSFQNAISGHRGQQARHAGSFVRLQRRIARRGVQLQLLRRMAGSVWNQRGVAVTGGNHQRGGTLQVQQQRGEYADLQQPGLQLVLHRYHLRKLRHAQRNHGMGFLHRSRSG